MPARYSLQGMGWLPDFPFVTARPRIRRSNHCSRAVEPPAFCYSQFRGDPSGVRPGTAGSPYDYVITGLAPDWWTLIKGEWVDSPPFTSSS